MLRITHIQVSVLLGYTVALMGNKVQTFREHHAVTKRRAPITQYRGAISHKNGAINFTDEEA
jgi:hypothetical protein